MSELIIQKPATMPIPQPPSESAALINMIERMARDPSVDIEKLGKMLELRRQIVAEQAKNAFDQAMNVTQAEMTPIRTDATNPQTKSKYATYDALDRELRPIYTRNGFSVSWNTGDAPHENEVRVLAYLSNGGHTRDYKIDMPADGKGAKGGDVMTKTHATGSAVTYGRRYLLGMIFNIAVTNRDDDGNAAAGGCAPITAEQAKELRKLIQASAREQTSAAIQAAENSFLAWAHVEKVEDVLANLYDGCVAGLKNKITQRKGAAS